MSNEKSYCLPGVIMPQEYGQISPGETKLKRPIHCACIQKGSVRNTNNSVCQSGGYHDETKFYLCCSCSECLAYRNKIVDFTRKQLLSASLWSNLKGIIREYYKIIFKNGSYSREKFGEASSNGDYGWQESGSAFDTELRYLDISKFTPEMKLVISCTLLQGDDSHQLLELLCSEAEYIAKSYSKGISDKRYNPSHSETELPKINYILQGYQSVCEISEKIEALLFGFQNYHLQKFSLSWTLVNKRMFQKYVYDTFTENAHQTLLKLKDEVSTKQYIEILTEYIALDDEMSLVKETWKTVWEALNKYHMTNEDIHRRERIRIIHKTFEMLQKLPEPNLAETLEPTQWRDLPNLEDIWEHTIAALQKTLIPNNNLRMHATTRSEKCVSCKAWIDNHKTSCKCTTCLIAGPFFSNAKQDLVKSLCFQCAFMQNAIQNTNKLPMFVNNLKTLLKNKKSTESILNSMDAENYHLSWVVFNNLPDRKMYSESIISSKGFCNDCNKIECIIAKGIINNEFSPELVKMLLKYYQPLSLNEEKAVTNVSPILEFFDKVRTEPTLNFSIENIAEKMFFSFCFSTLMTQLGLAAKSNSKLSIENLELRNGDIHLRCDYTPLNSSLNDMLSLGDLFTNIPKLTTQLDYRPNDPSKTDSNLIVDDPNKNISCQVNGPTQTENRSQKKINSGNSQKAQKIRQDELNHRNSIESWIKQTLNFIEDDKKEKGTNKKMEKRNRQKLKKEECKRIEELYKLKSEYQDVYFKEFYAKQELKNYKTSKKKDKKKISELENYIKKINSTKVKIEQNILQTLRIVKSTNSNFKLSYLPTKEELEYAMCKLSKLPEKDKYGKTNNLLTLKDSSESSSFSTIIMNEDSGTSYFEANVMNGIPESPPVASTTTFTTDPSKSIVTIRRVNLPHLSEPQVTVTAKGRSPQDDKLLYTFINGQIVPASCLEPKMRQILATPNTSILPKDVYTQFKEETNANEFVKTINCCESNACDNESVSVIPSETEYTNYANSENARGYSGRTLASSSSNMYFKRHHIAENERQFIPVANNRMNIAKSDQTSYNQEFRNSLTLRNENPEETHEDNGSDILCTSMRDLNIRKNEDVHAENNTGYNTTDSHWSWNISIMDQINKGVQVENLMLPPGITLTKIDPEKSERVKAKRQSIDNLSHRLKCVQNPPDQLPDEVSVQLLPSSDAISATLEPAFNKKKRRKNTSTKSCTNADIGPNKNHIGPHTSVYETDNTRSIHLSASPFNTNRVLPKVQPAAIIKKENGMYTIRNPAMRETNTLTPLPRFYSSVPNKSEQQEKYQPAQCFENMTINCENGNTMLDARYDGRSRKKTMLSQKYADENPYPEVTIYNTSGNKNVQANLNTADLKAYLSKSNGESRRKSKQS